MKIKYQNVPEHATRLAMLKTGEADLIQLNFANIDDVKKDPKLNIFWSKFVQLRTLIFLDLKWPKDPSPWHDIRVRKAAIHAINREAICKKVLRGAAEPWGMIIAKYHPGSDPPIPPLPYDPEKAKKLLAEAGYPKGFDTTLHTSVLFNTETQAVAMELNKVGIRAKLNTMEHGIWARNCKQSKLRGINNHPTPYWVGRNVAGGLTSTVSMGAGGWTHHTTPELEQMLRDLSGATTVEEQARLARKLVVRYRELYFRGPLWAKHYPFAYGPNVAYYAGVPGSRTPSCIEFMRLK